MYGWQGILVDLVQWKTKKIVEDGRIYNVFAVFLSFYVADEEVVSYSSGMVYKKEDTEGRL